MDLKRLHASFIVLTAILAIGTFGYVYIEHFSFFDALYMTIITISSVGFSEIHTLSVQGRILTMIIICASISIGAYSMAVIVRGFIEGELQKRFEKNKMEKQIRKLKNHYIVCGFGRIGRIICKELREDDIDFVVIEQDVSAIEQFEKLKYLYLQMDATTEEALLKAGIMNAKGLVTAVRSDANNVFITLTAKGIHPDIYVLSRTSDIKNEDKLKRAGANRVVSPYFIGGRRMAQELKRPAVVDFIDIATRGNKLGLIMEEAVIKQGSELIGKNLIESQLRKDFGIIIVCIKKASGEMVFNPMPDETLDADDILVVLGKNEDVIRMYDVL